MKIRIHVLEGLRQGLSRTYDSPRVRVGRHPDSDLQFDPESEREVSTYHAVLARDEDGWFVRDLDSRNGTLVNGEPVEGDHRLEDGDRIRFGRGGPLVRVTTVPDTVAGEERDSGDEAPSTTSILRSEVGRRVRNLRLIALSLAGLLAIVLLLLFIRETDRDARWSEERRTLQRQSDSILASSARTVDSLRGRAEGLRNALDRSRRRLASLREELASRTGTTSADSGRSRQELRRRLESATAALRRQQLAADFDFESVEERNWSALAKIYVERSGAAVTTATAFAVHPDALLLTNRHVVLGEDEGRPDRIGIQFARSDQVWPARIVATSREADLALVRAENVAGEVPTVRGLNGRPDTLPAGAPLAVIGYPLGGPPPGDGSSRSHAPPPLVTSGLLLQPMDGVARIQGYGEPGGSGSPIFDAGGRVVAVLRGGSTEDGGRDVLLGVPASAAVRLLSSVTGSSADAPGGR